MLIALPFTLRYIRKLFRPLPGYRDGLFKTLLQTENDFNPIEAQAVGDQPESTGITASTGTTSPGPSPTTTMTGATHKKSDAGAIAGGVVGGFIAVCGLVVAAAYWRSGRRRISPSMVNIDEKPRPFAISNSSVLPSSYTGPGFHASVPSMPVPSTGHKLYDPNDPSTFPSSAQSRSGHSAQSSESKDAVFYQSMSPNRRPVAPEIQ
ncbi:hypothetical protein D9757_003687 [Collybiopsis confluens]|uniref:Uncharacterized protein n=1 Tax=Collybiopsis confluens TaxID=2823264 RepID=A0A8H5MDF8_9AGAR|nr:hypothetical protein D9757_003687 [Collybiopsis confluens]